MNVSWVRLKFCLTEEILTHPKSIRVSPPLFAGGSKSSKGSGRSNGRKAKSPGPGLSGSERPSSVSSVHSEGDCNRRTPLTNRVWEDRPLSAGTMHAASRWVSGTLMVNLHSNLEVLLTQLYHTVLIKMFLFFLWWPFYGFSFVFIQNSAFNIYNRLLKVTSFKRCYLSLFFIFLGKAHLTHTKQFFSLVINLTI